MNTHPEQQEDEIYIGNTLHEEEFDNAGINGIRYGRQCYDIDGNPFSMAGMRPMFIKKKNYHEYDQYKMKKMGVDVVKIASRKQSLRLV